MSQEFIMYRYVAASSAYKPESRVHFRAHARALSLLHKIALGACMVAGACIAHAETAKNKAVQGAVGDGISTAVGLAAGAAEVNPLGPVLSIGMKAVMLRYADTLPDTQRPAMYAAAASWWQGATANNLCITASILSGGAFAPACVVLGVAWGMKTWKETEYEREFWEGCALLRQYADEPELKCIYTPPANAVAVNSDMRVAVVHEDIAP